MSYFIGVKLQSHFFRNFVDCAQKSERNYRWFEASKFYEKALAYALCEKNFLLAGEMKEKAGFCLYRAAMQAGNRVEFIEKIMLSIKCYGEAVELYEKLDSVEKQGRIFRCRAVNKYLSYLLAPDPFDKRELLDECLKLEGEALAFFSKFGDMKEYVRTFNDLFLVFGDRALLEWDRKRLKKVLTKGLKWAEKALSAVSELEDAYEHARLNLGLAICLSYFLAFLVEQPERQEKYRQKIIGHLNKALKCSQTAKDSFLAGISHFWLGIHVSEQEKLEHYRKVLELGEMTRDNMLKAVGLTYLANTTDWKAMAVDDPDERRRLIKEAIKLYRQAERFHSKTSAHGLPSEWLKGILAEEYLLLAMLEIDVQKRRKLLKKAEKTALKALKLAEATDLPFTIASVLHIVAKVMEARARHQTVNSKRKELLEKALKFRGKGMSILENLKPFDYWNRGVTLNYLAELKAQLADFEPNLEGKIKLLEEAAADKELCLKLIEKTFPQADSANIMLLNVTEQFQESYASLLMKMYAVLKKPEYLERSIELMEEAIKAAFKAEMFSVVAELQRKVALANDILGRYLEAADAYSKASEAYQKAVARNPKLKSVHRDYSLYVEVWNQIEKAKYYHLHKEYGKAREYFRKAAEICMLTERWRYLASNCEAWALLDEAEELSRKEHAEKARNLFQHASELFSQVKKSVQAKLVDIEDEEERKIAEKLIKASSIRQKYCVGRTFLEDAKIRARSKDFLMSSRKYVVASRFFREIVEAKTGGEASREVEPIIYLCQAWSKMMMAEAKVDPKLYGKASRIFVKASKCSPDRETSLLALANSSLCKALEAAVKFERTADGKHFIKAKNHLEAAAKYYLKAGLKHAYEYVSGTMKLLDAYFYMNMAGTEAYPAKKANYYRLAENLLQAAVEHYLRSKHVVEINEVNKILEKVKEEREFALSLSMLLRVPELASSSSMFLAPNPTFERPTSLEEGGHAQVESYINVPSEVEEGCEFEVNLDLINVSRESCLLIKISNIVPADFEATSMPSGYSPEGNSLDLKGKRLGPLKVESIKFNLRPVKAGTFNLRPYVIYMDNTGRFRTFRPKVSLLTVHPKAVFEFKSEASKKVFDFLVASFIEDYMKRRIPFESSGWRTLMQIVKSAKVTKWSVYGSGLRKGRALAELERRGLIEARIFPEERGRGGKILKLRVVYHKEPLKRYIDSLIMNSSEK